MKLIKKFEWDEGINDYLINKENQLFGPSGGLVAS